MSYNEHILGELKYGQGIFREAIIKFRSLEGRRVLYYSHDDPDGITSAVLMTKIFKKLDIDYEIYLPETYELERFRVEEAVAKTKRPFDALIVTDKGTQERFDTYTEIIKDIIIIDHHFIQGMPKKCLVFHPQIQCSCSHLVHMILTGLGMREDYDDFLNLIGLKGDWTIDPVRDFAAEFVQPFVDEVKPNFAGLFRKTRGDTWFDIKQDGITCTLSQITEFLHALCGGGFQFFYNDRDKSLQNLNQPFFTSNILNNMRKNISKVKKISTLKNFIDILPDKKTALKIWNFYRSDWEKAKVLVDSTAPVGDFGLVKIFLYIGNQIPLIPMLGSVKLNELAKRYNCEDAVLVMVNLEKNKNIHFSMRALTDKVHVGKICNNLATRLQKRFNDCEQITGGGHPTAGECKIRRTDIPLLVCIKEFMDILNKMYNFSKQQTLEEEDKKQAFELGLEYLKIKMP
ncbi:MAG: DHH family phosphoesterase [Candidatus Hydrogenedentota bacterium]